MKDLNKIFLFIIVFISLHLQAQKVYTVDDVPNPTKTGNDWIADPAGYLDTESVKLINSIIYEINNASTAQIAVVMLPDIGQEIPKDFAVQR